MPFTTHAVSLDTVLTGNSEVVGGPIMARWMCSAVYVSGTYVAERCHYYYGYFLTERHHYYYGNFRYRFRNPAEDHSLVVNRRNGRRADKASSVAERK